jgi:GTP-binding protein YchF
MHLGIIGPAQSGKTTLFRAATGATPTSGAGALRAVVKVPDPRLSALAELVHPRKIVPAEVEYLDWGGVATDPTQAADLESKIPAEIRACDALVAVLRAFRSDVVAHPRGSVDAPRDLSDLQTALVLADLTTVETRLERLDRTLKVKKDPVLEAEQKALARCRAHLESERPLRALDLSREEQQRLRGFGFLTVKPLLLVLNVGEEELPDAPALEADWQARLRADGCAVVALCAQIEMEIAQLADLERAAFLADMKIAEPALGRMIRASYGLLGLISYFTAGEPEVRAWTIPEGATAVEAADVIHSDIARGFIRAEVIPYADYIAHRGVAGAKHAGRFRLEGKDYVVRDGDVIYFRFNV